MPLKNYGVLKGKVVRRRLASRKSTYFHIKIEPADELYRAAINVYSDLKPAELLYFVDEDYQHPILDGLAELPHGHTELPRRPGGLALDYIRSNLFNFDRLKPYPFALKGPDNDLNEKIDRHVFRAMKEEGADIYVFGERWGPEHQRKDIYFGFRPSIGIHDIHMNQANTGRFLPTDGPWQDGAVLLHFPQPEQWVAIFLAFQSQARHSDDSTGARIDTAPPNPLDPLARQGGLPPELSGAIRIVGALVRPAQNSAAHQSVTLLNTLPVAVNLQGWALLDYFWNRAELSGTIPAGGVLTLPLPDNLQATDSGGGFTLVDSNGLKVSGVSYTAQQALNSGWTIAF